MQSFFRIGRGGRRQWDCSWIAGSGDKTEEERGIEDGDFAMETERQTAIFA